MRIWMLMRGIEDGRGGVDGWFCGDGLLGVGGGGWAGGRLVLLGFETGRVSYQERAPHTVDVPMCVDGFKSAGSVSRCDNT